MQNNAARVKPQCPWCLSELSPDFTKNIGNYPQPCPTCGQSVRTSIWQVLFIVACLLPIIGTALVLSKITYDNGSAALAVAILLGGGILSMFVQKYIPTINGPAKASVGKSKS